MSDRPPVDTVTTAVVEYITSRRPTSFSSDSIRMAVDAVTDTVAVILASRGQPEPRILIEALGDGGAGPSLDLVSGSRTNPAHAALVNATAGHSMDYDDVSFRMYGHPSVVLVPTLLALAEREGASGAEVIAAYLTGLRVNIAIAEGLPVRAHYSQGWHATATVGRVGATAAACQLLGLNEQQTRMALGIVSSMAAGTRQNFGTMTKALHAGLTARDAIVAADLAAHGFSASADIFDGHAGYFDLYGRRPDPHLLLDVLSATDESFDYGLSVKWHPCCFNTHRMIDVALNLARSGDVNLNSIEAVHVTAEPRGLEPLIDRLPLDGTEARFSGHFVTAYALTKGKLGLGAFEEGALADPMVTALSNMVSLFESDIPPVGPAVWSDAYATLEIRYRDGRVVHGRSDLEPGRPADHGPVRSERIREKFSDCLEIARLPHMATSLYERLQQIQSADHIDLSDLLATQQPLPSSWHTSS